MTAYHPGYSQPAPQGGYQQPMGYGQQPPQGHTAQPGGALMGGQAPRPPETRMKLWRNNQKQTDTQPDARGALEILPSDLLRIFDDWATGRLCMTKDGQKLRISLSAWQNNPGPEGKSPVLVGQITHGSDEIAAAAQQGKAPYHPPAPPLHPGALPPSIIALVTGGAGGAPTAPPVPQQPPQQQAPQGYPQQQAPQGYPQQHPMAQQPQQPQANQNHQWVGQGQFPEPAAPTQDEIPF